MVSLTPSRPLLPSDWSAAVYIVLSSSFIFCRRGKSQQHHKNWRVGAHQHGRRPAASQEEEEENSLPWPWSPPPSSTSGPPAGCLDNLLIENLTTPPYRDEGNHDAEGGGMIVIIRR
ncbi:hypothetical protein OUZ56_022773 [Daphnia magna]|uniref:Uncharacterized protein n=1 Tax=Daphnia magna TaxID=35525 RepID=A0ABR0AXI8_9CRUS|nr:hypothetical protein OUZ56_022773 [Daphnia magna]